MKKLILLLCLFMVGVTFSQQKKKKTIYKHKTTITLKKTNHSIPKVTLEEKKETNISKDVVVSTNSNTSTPVEYPDGIVKFRQQLLNDITFPDNLTTALKMQLKFIVEKDGSVSNISFIYFNDLAEESKQKLEAELKSALLKTKKWNPATENGLPVKHLFVLPLTFLLE